MAQLPSFEANSFLTKTSLNNIIAESNNQDDRLDTAELDIVALQGQVNSLTGDLVILVGAGEDYTSLQDAIDFAMTIDPKGYKLYIIIRTGTTLTEQVVCSGNLSFVEINTEGASVLDIDQTGYTGLNGERSFFQVYNGISPVFRAFRVNVIGRAPLPPEEITTVFACIGPGSGMDLGYFDSGDAVIITGDSYNGITAYAGGVIRAMGVTIAAGEASGFNVRNGGQIILNGFSSGSTNQTQNTITGQGIIYKP